MLRSPSIALLAALAGCSGGTEAALTVAPTADAQQLATTPWPSDLFLDEGGHVALQTLPASMVDLTAPTLDDLHTRQDGFAVWGGAYFPVTAAIDPSTLDGNVHLVDLTDGTEMPVYTHFRAKDTPMQIYARPLYGGVLLERHGYAWVITNKVKTATGAALQPSSDLSSLLSSKSPPSGTLARAYTIYQPLLALLDQGKPASRSDVAAATVFTTHSITQPLTSMRAALGQAAPPAATVKMIFAATVQTGDDGSLDELLGTPTSMLPGLDNPGGIWHGDIGYIVQGTFTTPDYLNNTTTVTPAWGTPTTIDFFDDDSGRGAAHPKGTAVVPFTLVIPLAARVNGSYANLPVVIFQHGLGGNRSGMMGVANSICAQGFAVLGIDIPFHGGRDATATDMSHAFTSAQTPDGWAEVSDAPFIPFFDATGSVPKMIPALLPRAVRDAFMQAALDAMQEARLIAVGDVSAIGQKDARLASLTLRHDAIGYSGESFGSMIGGITIAIEPTIGAAFLDVGGGGLLFPLLLASEGYGPKIAPFLDGALGTVTGDPDDPTDTDFMYNLSQYLLETGDAAAYAPYVVFNPVNGNAPKHVLQPSAHLDETVPNQANEHLARSMGLLPVNLPMGGTVDLQYWANPSSPATAPVSGNVTVGGKPVTAAFFQFEQASHGMFDSLKGQHTVDLSQPYPYPKITPVPIANPTARLQQIYSSFMKDFFAGRVPTLATGL
jgi:hypothetical protein